MHSQVPTTCPHPESEKSSPCSPIPLLEDHLIASSLLHLGFPSGLFPPGLPTISLYAPHVSPKRATCPTHPILLDFIMRIISVSNTDHKDHRVLFSTPLLPHPSQAQISSSAPILKLPQPMFLPQSERPSFTPIPNNRQKYSSVYVYLYTFG